MSRRDGIQLSLFRLDGTPAESPREGPVEQLIDGDVAQPTFLLSEDGGLWSKRERSAWAPPDGILVSEWAERHRMVSATSAAPGEWNNAPYYTVEVMNAFVDPLVERITIMASVQSSKTESAYNMLGYAISQDPASALVVMPSLKTLKRVNRRIHRMILDSPELAKHLTGNPDDVTKDELRLDNMTIYFATAGSSTDVRNVDARYIYCDETDDYERSVSDQGSPIEMAEARSTTFWNRKIIHSCTPTFEHGYIAIEYNKSDRCKFWVPCPHCKGYQALSFWQVKHRGEQLGKWPRDKREPDYIRRNRVARYECLFCKYEIDDRDKRWMLRFGTWVPEGHAIERDGTTAIPRPRAMHRGFHWPALYSPWLSFSDVAAKYFDSKGDIEKYKAFVTLWLAETWKHVIVSADQSGVLSARCDLAPQEVPNEAIALTCVVDVQKNGRWFTVRAWAGDTTSWLIHYGLLAGWDEVEDLLFGTTYPVVDSSCRMGFWRAAVDLGGGDKDDGLTMTEDTLLWLLRNHRRGLRIWGTKGSSRALGVKCKPGSVLVKTPSGKALPGGLQQVLLDTGMLKDAFHYRLQLAMAHQPQGAYLHSGTDDLYASHITAEEKRRNAKGADQWEKIRPRNDLLDCECMSLALVDISWPGGGINLLRGSTAIDPGACRSAPAPAVGRSSYVDKMLNR